MEDARARMHPSGTPVRSAARRGILVRRVVVEMDWDDLDVVSPAGVTERRVVSDDWRPAETAKTRAVTVARVDIVYRFSRERAASFGVFPSHAEPRRIGKAVFSQLARMSISTPKGPYSPIFIHICLGAADTQSRRGHTRGHHRRCLRHVTRSHASQSAMSHTAVSAASLASKARVAPKFTRAGARGCAHSRSSAVKVTAAKGDVLLEVKDLTAKVAETGEEILTGVTLTIKEGETHAIMGKNGSGKSTFTKVLVGHPSYEVTGGTATFRGQDLFAMEPEERARTGLFLSFQSPIEVPGVSNTDFLRMMCNERRKSRGEPELDPLEFYGFLTPKLEQLNMDPSFLARNVNEGFSGGEKKRNEILQLAVMESEMSILDEIDSGLDVDALRDVAAAVNVLKEGDKGLLLITHYQRLLDAIHPDFVHVMQKGKIVQTGDVSIAAKLEEGGFEALTAK